MGVLFGNRALGAPQLCDRQAPDISILNRATNGSSGSLGLMSAKFGGIPERTATGCSRSCFTALVNCGPPRVHVRATRRGAGSWSKKRRLRRGKGCCEVSVVPRAGAIAGGGAPDLRASLSPLVDVSFATLVRGGNEIRGMPNSQRISDGELEAWRHTFAPRRGK